MRMLSCSECMELVDRFKKSCEKNDLSESPYNLIVFLECEELLKDKQLMKADREGRCVVLPCKVGDTVYAHCFGYVDEGVIESFSINQYRLAARFVATDGAEGSFFKEDFGKTVFLTREEAEAALAKEGVKP